MPSRRFSPSLWMVLLAIAAILVPTTLAASRGDGTFSTRNTANDRRAPKPVSSLRVTGAQPSSVTVDWSRAWDNQGVQGYGVYLDGARSAQTPETRYTLQSLACGHGYNVGVDAFDDAGNRSPQTSTFVSTSACRDVTPPSVPSGVRTVAVTATSVILAWTPSSDDFGVVGYGLYVGGFWVGSWSDPSATITNLSCGQTYQIGIDANDAAGNQSARTDAFFSTAPCTDRTPPSAPRNVSVAKSTQTSVTLGWTASTDASGISEYGLYRDGAKTATATTTSGDVGGLECGKTYTLGVDAADKAQNRSPITSVTAATAACTSTTPPPPSNTGPTAPPNLRASSVTQTSVSLAWDASSASAGMSGYQVFRDGAKIGEGPGVHGGYANEWNDGGRTCGTSYQYAVAGVDSKGAVGPKTTVTVPTAACDTPATPPPPPPTTPPPPPPSDTKTTDPSMPPALHTTSVTQSSVGLAWDPSSATKGVSLYRISRDGVKLGEGPGSSGGFTNTWNDSGRTCGTKYAYSVVAVDKSGTSGAPATLSVTTAACSQSAPPPPPSSAPPPPSADTTAPSMPASVNASTRTATSIALSWQPSTDNVGVTGYGVYRGGTRVSTPTATTWIFSGLTCNTSYTLAVDAVDAAGNRSQQAVVMVSTTACADTQAPTTPTALTASNVTQTSTTLGWTASKDNVGVAGYDVMRNGADVANVTTTAAPQSNLTCGTPYTLAVVAYDAAGNRSPQAQLVTATTACTPTPTPPPPPPPPPSSPTGNVTVSGTVSGAQLNTLIAGAPSGAVTVTPAAGQSSFTVTGTWTPNRQGVTVQNGVFTTIDMASSGSGLTVRNSQLRDFQVDGGNNWTLDGNVLDSKCQVAQNFLYRSSGWRILNNTIRNYHLCSDESTHSEAFYIGAGASDGLIQGNRFDENGTTAHLFFTWFDQGGSGSQNPHNICVTGNTFTNSHNGYYSVQLRAELPDSLNIRVDPNDSYDTNALIGNEVGPRTTWVKACSAP